MVQCKRGRDEITCVTENLRFEEFKHTAISSPRIVHVSEYREIIL